MKYGISVFIFFHLETLIFIRELYIHYSQHLEGYNILQNATMQKMHAFMAINCDKRGF